MKCFHLPIVQGNKERTMHINADNVESLSPKSGDFGTEIGMCSGTTLETSLELETVLKRINAAHVQHSRNGE